MPADDSYDLKPPENPPAAPKPGDPDWVPPVPIIEKADPEPEPAPADDPDVHNNKAMAILAYICFIIPLVAAPKSPFARFHANQGLMVFILWCTAIVICFFLEGLWKLASWYLTLPGLISALFACITSVIPFVLFIIAIAFSIMGIINAANGESKPLPLIGHWKPIK